MFNRKELMKRWVGKRKRDEDDSKVHLLSPVAATPKKVKKSKKPLTNEERQNNLIKACNDRLAFSQFRAMNEFLYSHHSQDAQKYMSTDNFDKYHNAYDQLADKWPVKPIEEVLSTMQKLYRKREKGCVFADMGCGSKPLVRLRFKKATVHSFDLVSKHKDIVQADIAHVPLENESCDCVVFCLSLMGTNIEDYIVEANRILKNSGSLIIAEVTSRFEEEDVKTFTKKLTKGYGFQLKHQKYLAPNSYFVLLRFEKVQQPTLIKGPKFALTLKPCTYKPR